MRSWSVRTLPGALGSVGALADKFIREAPFKVKVTSPAQMESIRTFNVRGVVLSHVPVPPPDIPQRAGCHYFLLSREGKHWDAVRDVRTLCVSSDRVRRRPDRVPLRQEGGLMSRFVDRAASLCDLCAGVFAFIVELQAGPLESKAVEPPRYEAMSAR